MTNNKIYGPWIKWDGCECPVPPKTLVKIKLRAGCCNFNYGYRGGEIKSFEFCAVAVRRIPIGGEL